MPPHGMIDKETERRNLRRLNVLTHEIDDFVDRVKEGLYTQLEKDLILSRIEVAFNVENGIPESDIQSREERDVPTGQQMDAQIRTERTDCSRPNG